MAEAGNNVIEIVLKSVDQMSADLQKLDQRLGNIEKSSQATSRATAGLSSNFTKLGSTVIVLNQGLELLDKILGPVARGFNRGIQEAADYEKQLSLLKNTLTAFGKEVPIDELSRFASETEKAFKIADTSILEVTRRIASSTDLDGRALQELSIAAIALSKHFEIDLNTATRGLSQIMNGAGSNIRGTAIEIDEATPISERYAAVMAKARPIIEAVSKSSGTLTDKQQELGVALSNLAKAVGEPLLGPLKRISSVLAQVVGGFTEFVKAHPEISSAFGAVALAVAGLGAAVATLATVQLAGLGPALATATAALAAFALTPAGLVLIGVALLATGAAFVKFSGDVHDAEIATDPKKLAAHIAQIEAAMSKLSSTEKEEMEPRLEELRKRLKALEEQAKKTAEATSKIGDAKVAKPDSAIDQAQKSAARSATEFAEKAVADLIKARADVASQSKQLLFETTGEFQALQDSFTIAQKGVADAAAASLKQQLADIAKANKLKVEELTPLITDPIRKTVGNQAALQQQQLELQQRRAIQQFLEQALQAEATLRKAIEAQITATVEIEQRKLEILREQNAPIREQLDQLGRVVQAEVELATLKLNNLQKEKDRVDDLIDSESVKGNKLTETLALQKQISGELTKQQNSLNDINRKAAKAALDIQKTQSEQRRTGVDASIIPDQSRLDILNHQLSVLQEQQAPYASILSVAAQIDAIEKRILEKEIEKQNILVENLRLQVQAHAASGQDLLVAEQQLQKLKDSGQIVADSLRQATDALRREAEEASRGIAKDFVDRFFDVMQGSNTKGGIKEAIKGFLETTGKTLISQIGQEAIHGLFSGRIEELKKLTGKAPSSIADLLGAELKVLLGLNKPPTEPAKSPLDTAAANLNTVSTGSLKDAGTSLRTAGDKLSQVADRILSKLGVTQQTDQTANATRETAPRRIEETPPIKVEDIPPVEVKKPAPLEIEEPPVLKAETVPPIQIEPIRELPTLKVESVEPLAIEKIAPLKVETPVLTVEDIPQLTVERPIPQLQVERPLPTLAVETVPPIRVQVEKFAPLEVEDVPTIPIEKPQPLTVEPIAPLKVESVPPLTVERQEPLTVADIPLVRVEIAPIDAPVLKVEDVLPLTVERPLPTLSVEPIPPIRVEPISVEKIPSVSVDPIRIEQSKPLQVDAPILKVEPQKPLTVEPVAPLKVEPINALTSAGTVLQSAGNALLQAAQRLLGLTPTGQTQPTIANPIIREETVRAQSPLNAELLSVNQRIEALLTRRETLQSELPTAIGELRSALETQIGQLSSELKATTQHKENLISEKAIDATQLDTAAVNIEQSIRQASGELSAQVKPLGPAGTMLQDAGSQLIAAAGVLSGISRPSNVITNDPQAATISDIIAAIEASKSVPVQAGPSTVPSSSVVNVSQTNQSAPQEINLASLTGGLGQVTGAISGLIGAQGGGVLGGIQGGIGAIGSIISIWEKIQKLISQTPQPNAFTDMNGPGTSIQDINDKEFGDMIRRMQEGFQETTQSVLDNVNALSTLSDTVNSTDSILGGLGNAFGGVINILGGFGNAAISVINSLSSMASSLGSMMGGSSSSGGGIGGIFGSIFSIFGSFMAMAKGGIVSPAATVHQFAKGAIVDAKSRGYDIPSFSQGGLSLNNEMVKHIKEYGPGIPAFAQGGGVLKGPTLAVAGEAGPELFAPIKDTREIGEFVATVHRKNGVLMASRNIKAFADGEMVEPYGTTMSNVTNGQNQKTNKDEPIIINHYIVDQRTRLGPNDVENIVDDSMRRNGKLAHATQHIIRRNK